MPDAYTQQGLINEGCTSGTSLHATRRGVDSIRPGPPSQTSFTDASATRETHKTRNLSAYTEVCGYQNPRPGRRWPIRGQSREPKWTQTPLFSPRQYSYRHYCACVTTLYAAGTVLYRYRCHGDLIPPGYQNTGEMVPSGIISPASSSATRWFDTSGEIVHP